MNLSLASFFSFGVGQFEKKRLIFFEMAHKPNYEKRLTKRLTWDDVRTRPPGSRYFNGQIFLEKNPSTDDNKSMQNAPAYNMLKEKAVLEE